MMNIDLADEFLPFLKHNQEVLDNIEKKDKNNIFPTLHNMSLIADKFNHIAVWKIFNNDKPHHYFYIPAWDYQRILDEHEIQRYSRGVFEMFLENNDFKNQLNQIQLRLSSYSELDYDFQHNKTVYNEIFGEVYIAFKNSQNIKIRLDLLYLKDQDVIPIIKQFVELNPHVHYFPEILNHINDVTQAIEEKNNLETSIITEKNTQPKIKI